MTTGRQFQLGSLLCEVVATPSRYAHLLAEVYGTYLTRLASARVGLSIEIVEEASLNPGDSDTLVVQPIDGGYRLTTDPLECRLLLCAPCPQARLRVRQPDMPTQQLGFHFWILINRMLLLLERVLLHAAAVHYEDRLNLFSGHRGAGKSTLSIALAQSGGTLLAEDHVILRRTAGEFLVSGCTSRMRVTAETERGLLERPLELAAVDVGGTLKKEFPAEEFFASRPYEDRKPDRLFLTRVGEAFSCRPLPPREALLRMVDTTGVMLRFANREDYASFLEFLAAFVKTVTTYELVLSPDISRVREMTGVLRELSEKEASDGAH